MTSLEDRKKTRNGYCIKLFKQSIKEMGHSEKVHGNILVVSNLQLREICNCTTHSVLCTTCNKLKISPEIFMWKLLKMSSNLSLQ